MPIAKRLSLLLATTALLSGCGLFDDRYERPQTVLPAAWAEAAQSADGQADSKVARDWWINFGTPGLDALEAQALQQNFDIGAAIARIRQADAQARIAGAPLLPSLGLSGGATRAQSGSGGGTTVIGTNGTTVGSNGGTVNGGSTTGTGTTTSGTTTGATTGTVINSGSTPRNSFTGRLNASYELDFWGRNADQLESANAAFDASRYDRETVTLTATGNVAITYFTILELQDRIAIAQKNLASAQDLLDAFNKRASVGLVSGLDVAQQENLVATQRTVLPGLQYQLRQNLDALAILTGQLPEAVQVSAPAGGLADVAMPSVAPGLPSTLLVRRPDVGEAEAQLRAANADVNAARAAFFPTISLTGSYGYSSNQLSSLVGPGNRAWSIGTDLVQTIFDSGALFGQLDLNKGRREELLQDYRKAVVSAFADTEDALSGVQNLAAQEEAQREVMRTAQVAYDLSQRQFGAGITDITTVLNTQRTLFAAQDSYLTTRQARLAAIVSLYQALGGGWYATKDGAAS